MCEDGSLPSSVPTLNYNTMKVLIDVPDGIDINYVSIMDALDFSDNVTQQEYDLIETILSQLKTNYDNRQPVR